MPNLVYSPGIRVFIQTEPKSQAKGKVLDVSDDVVDFQLQRRSDGVSTFNFTLTNQNRKYDQVFTPNDRIVVEMKRITWVRVFTGYLNSVPLVTVWPRNVPISASCTLKRLQYWYWDAYAPQTQNMIRTALTANQATGDLSVIEVIYQILEKVTNWPRDKVHISQIPKNWFNITNKMAQFVEQNAEQADKVANALFAAVGAIKAVTGDAAGQATGLLNGQTIDGFTGDQLKNAETIYSTGAQQGASTRDQVVALMAAMAASNLNNTPATGTASGGGTGIYKFTASSGTATEAQLADVATSAKEFFKKLITISTRDTMTYGQEAQAIMGTGTAAQYDKFQKAAQDIVDTIQKKAAESVGIQGTNPTKSPGIDSVFKGTAPTPTTGGNSTPTGTGSPAAQPGSATGDSFVGKAKSLVALYPNIPYTQQYTGTRMDVLTATPPPGLDCSSFVQWVYLNVMGTLGPFQDARVVAQQRTISKIIDKQTALKTPGALLFVNEEHVEVSIGDGTHSVGSHHTGTMASIGNSPDQWTDGGLIPNITYGALGQGGGSTDGATPSGTVGPGANGIGPTSVGSGGSTTSGTAWPTYVPYSQANQGYNQNDSYDKLFGNTPWTPAPVNVDDPGVILSLALTGLKTFLNDQPLLPYLKNLFNGIMRSFCSAPNGDLIAWFPDYYGLWGTAAKFTIEPIEILDFNVTWNDEYFVTHQFVATTPGAGLASNNLDLLTGQVGSNLSTDPIVTTQTLSYTRGIASVDVPAMMYALFGLDMADGDAAKFAEYITSKFGVRPNFISIPTISGPAAEFFASIFYFMRNWSYQYNADVPLTFMPELWPGMLLQIPSFGFQAYVTTVTHTGRFGDGGQFNTTVNIAAPAKLENGEFSDALGLLPSAAGVIAKRLGLQDLGNGPDTPPASQNANPASPGGAANGGGTTNQPNAGGTTATGGGATGSAPTTNNPTATSPFSVTNKTG